MFPARSFPACLLVFASFWLIACSDSSTDPPTTNEWVEVDLTQYPDGSVVPNRTVLGDQWASVGIRFEARPVGVDAIKEDFGGDEGHVFFSPDVFGAVAIFRFVDPATNDPVDATAFRLVPWFSPDESAELVGLDASGAEVVIDAIVPADIGGESLSLEMAIEGRFRVVEWRTHGNPGIAARSLAFKFE
jgi:hypothetical protein